MITDTEYHLQRARSEREIAYRSAVADASDAHMRLSALHLERAMLLQEVERAPAGNVIPFARSCAHQSAESTSLAPLVELPSCESANPS
jgi:hypothetical protein